MNKQWLEKAARQFAANPALGSLFFTTDGQGFVKKDDATLHARNGLKEAEPALQEITRADVSAPVKETAKKKAEDEAAKPKK